MTNLARRAVLAGSLGLGLSACSSGDKSAKSAGTGSGGSLSAGSASSGGAAGSNSAGSDAAGSDSSGSSVATTAELPRGGTTLLPAYRLFGWCGSPAGSALGQLGVGSFDNEVARMVREAPAWGGGRPVMPVLELIATIVQPTPGADGMFRTRVDDATLDQWSAKAKAIKGILLINIQPGLAEFIDEARYYDKWLREPHVGLALDPEWKIDNGQVPGKQFGHTTGADVDELSAYLAQLCQAHQLPQKALVVHVLRRYIFEKQDELSARPEVAVIKSVDGIGIPKDKLKAYDIVMAGTPSAIHPGFKLFFQEDMAAGGPMMTSGQVLGLQPQPDYILFE